jgi:predicted small secreted protein
MSTRIVPFLFLAASVSLGACATTRGLEGSGIQNLTTEDGETVRVVRGVSIADPMPMQCTLGHGRADLACNAAPVDHVYAQVMGLDDGNTRVADAPRYPTMVCDPSGSSSASCLDGSIASDDDE